MIDFLKITNLSQFENKLPPSVNIAIDSSIIGRSGYFDKWYGKDSVLTSNYYPSPQGRSNTAVRYHGVVRGINNTSIFVEEKTTGQIYHLPLTCFTFVVQ